MKVQAHSSLEGPLEYNQDQMSLMNKVRYDLLTILGVIEILWNFRLVVERKTGKDIPEFLEKFLANNFVYQMLKTIPPGC